MAEYQFQLGRMLMNYQHWQLTHPEANPKIQFNFPPNTAVIALISDAIRCHMVSCNGDGLALIKALWPWDGKSEPTVNMVRGVLEHEEGPA